MITLTLKNKFKELYNNSVVSHNKIHKSSYQIKKKHQKVCLPDWNGIIENFFYLEINFAYKSEEVGTRTVKVPVLA